MSIKLETSFIPSRRSSAAHRSSWGPERLARTSSTASAAKTPSIPACRNGTSAGRVIPVGLAILVCTASLAACSDGVSPVERLDVAVIGYFFDDSPRITVPDTVTAGQAFTVAVESYGNSCVRLGRTEVAVLPGGAVVTPLDFVTTAGVCQDVLLTFRHEASLSLNSAGLNRVWVRGREVPEGPIRDFMHEVWVR